MPRKAYFVYPDIFLINVLEFTQILQRKGSSKTIRIVRLGRTLTELIGKVMFLFMLGVVEMFIVSYWTKTVAESKIYTSGIVTVVNVLIWYYVLQTFVSDISNWYLVVSYAVGCAVGTMLCGFLSQSQDKRKAKKKKMALSKLENTSLVIE